MKTPTLYRKSTKTSRLINQEQNTPSLPVPRINPHVRVGLYRMTTGRDVLLPITNGAAMNAYLDSLDAQGMPYPELRIRL